MQTWPGGSSSSTTQSTTGNRQMRIWPSNWTEETIQMVPTHLQLLCHLTMVCWSERGRERGKEGGGGGGKREGDRERDREREKERERERDMCIE